MDTMGQISIVPPTRAQDEWGDGRYKAPRGSRLHNGIDLACYAGSIILSPHSGTVTKIGYPYSPDDEDKGHLRYVQITEKNKFLCRYFYVLPSVKVGEPISPGDEIGVAQGLSDIYPGITDHIHYEVKIKQQFVDPNKDLYGDMNEYL